MNFVKNLLFIVGILATGSCMQAIAAGTPGNEPQKVSHVKLDGDVDSLLVLSLVTQLSEELEKKPDVLLVQINTEGGDMDEGQDIIEILEQSPIPVVCVVDRKALSMGYIILQSSACDKRYMTSRSVLMMHSPSIRIPKEESDKMSKEDKENIQDFLNARTEAVLNEIAGRLKISREQLIKKTTNGREWWLGSKAALDSGSVDGVVSNVSELLKRLETNSNL